MRKFPNYYALEQEYFSVRRQLQDARVDADVSRRGMVAYRELVFEMIGATKGQDKQYALTCLAILEGAAAVGQEKSAGGDDQVAIVPAEAVYPTPGDSQVGCPPSRPVAPGFTWDGVPRANGISGKFFELGF